jgi:NAD(P)H-dependent FMN reductase
MMAEITNSPETPALRLAMIYGSTRRGRFCDTIADWARAETERHGRFAVDRVDPAQATPDRFASVLEAADAYLVLVPEYNHGYPAPLKALIDAHYDEWQAKPVAFVSYGGASGGIRAVEQLRQVFAELHAVTMRDAVSFANAAEQFDEQGQLRAPARARRSATAMLARLHWWATVLREARRTRPYAEVLA